VTATVWIQTRRPGVVAPFTTIMSVGLGGFVNAPLKPAGLAETVYWPSVVLDAART
jgi:hypothetical protein